MGDVGNMKQKVVSGLFWRLGERVGLQAITFLVSIVLMRILDPADYGVLSIVTVFITFATIITTNGFSTSLIQKYEADDLDFSSVFYFNTVFSILVYLLIFLAAPWVANFYGNPLIGPVLRVIALSVPISSVNSVQYVYVSRHMLYKRFFFSTLGGTLASAVVGLWMAYSGFGVWALVGQHLTNSFIDPIILWFTLKWRPKAVFSFQRLKVLFSYGWKMLITYLLDDGFSAISNLMVGKVYTEAQLANYTEGQKYPKMGASVVSSALGSVMLSALSRVQKEPDKATAIMQRALRTLSYLIFPMMAGLALVAEPLVLLVFGEKWLGCVPFLQLSCFTYAFFPIQIMHRELIKAMGKSDLLLVLEIIKKGIGIALLFVVLNRGVMAIALVTSGIFVFSALINTIPTRGLLGYTFGKQLRDLLPALLLTAGMAGAVALAGLLPLGLLAGIAVQMLCGVAVYVLLSVIFKVDSFHYLLDIAKGFLRGRKGRGAPTSGE